MSGNAHTLERGHTLDRGQLASDRPQSGWSLRYPVVTTFAALMIGALILATGSFTAETTIGALLAMVLVVLAAVDLEHRKIPNAIVIPAAVIVLLAQVTAAPGRAPEFVVAATVVGIAFLVPNIISGSWLGMGDVKLAVLLGAGLGWSAVLAVVIAFLSIFPVALAIVIRRGLSARKTTLPFGPFLALGAIAVLIASQFLSGMGS